MKSIPLILLCLLSVQAEGTWKREGRHLRRIRSNYGPTGPVNMPSGSWNPSGLDPSTGIAPDMATAIRVGNFLHGGPDHPATAQGQPIDGPPLPPVTTADDPVGFDAIRNFARGATAAIETYGPGNIPRITGATGAVTVGGVRVPGPVAGPLPASVSGPGTALGPLGGGGFVGAHDARNAAYGPSGVAPGNGLGAPGYDFNAMMQNLMNLQASGVNAEQFVGANGYTNGRAPSVFNYQPSFGGGKDFNHLPHILPAGGKTIQQLQAEADEQLRVIIARAHDTQHKTLDRINRLRAQYGVGTIGFDGYKDTFNRTGHIDLGTYKGLDLGTSIDASQLMTADGKLKLPVQNIYHKKIVGIKIPQPYPVKHEVAVPAPYPVHHYVKVPTPSTTVVQAPAPKLTITSSTSGNTYSSPQASVQLTPPAPQINIVAGGNTNYNGPKNNNVDDYDESVEYNTNSRPNFSIEPSKSVNSPGVTSLLTSAPVSAIVDSYGPPPAGPVGSLPSLTSFIGRVGFPPLSSSFSKFMSLSNGQNKY